MYCVSNKAKPLKQDHISFKRQLPLYLMLLIPAVLVLIFSYGSMFGIIMAFQDYVPGKGWYVFGSDFVGLENFRQLFNLSNMGSVIYNTVFIAVLKIVFGLVCGVLLALLLNEVKSQALKKGIQTAIFFPYFLSWVITAGMVVDLCSPNGFFSKVFLSFGAKPPIFLAEESLFPWILVISDLWKGLGYGAVVYLAAISSVDPTLYEAATMDGAGYVKKAIHVTIPSIMPVIILMAVLALGNVLNAGFEQVFNLYSPIVYSTGDILDTFIYRIGIQEGGQYSLSAAVGLFKSVVSFSLISIAYFVAYKKWDYKIF